VALPFPTSHDLPSLLNADYRTAPTFGNGPPKFLQLSANIEYTRGPHDRELEFQGVFTPQYLPYLSATAQQTAMSQLPSTPIAIKGKGKELIQDDNHNGEDESVPTPVSGSAEKARSYCPPYIALATS
jgi:hypothetical protein